METQKVKSIRRITKGRKGSAVDSSQFSSKKLVNFEGAEENLHYQGVRDIEPRDLSAKISDVVLVDVREPDEFTGELGHIPGAQLMPLGQIEEQISALPKDKTVVFVCRSGGRSARACSIAHQHGFEHIFNLKGGMILWNELHLTTEA